MNYFLSVEFCFTNYFVNDLIPELVKRIQETLTKFCSFNQYYAYKIKSKKIMKQLMNNMIFRDEKFNITIFS